MANWRDRPRTTRQTAVPDITGDNSPIAPAKSHGIPLADVPMVGSGASHAPLGKSSGSILSMISTRKRHLVLWPNDDPESGL
jgi:hypothetical protein